MNKNVTSPFIPTTKNKKQDRPAEYSILLTRPVNNTT
jgi:hypothetical protein